MMRGFGWLSSPAKRESPHPLEPNDEGEERPGALVESNAPQIIAVCCLECAVCRQQLLFSRDEMKSDMQ
jgi:hypothetical protein